MKKLPTNKLGGLQSLSSLRDYVFVRQLTDRIIIPDSYRGGFYSRARKMVVGPKTAHTQATPRLDPVGRWSLKSASAVAMSGLELDTKFGRGGQTTIFCDEIVVRPL